MAEKNILEVIITAKDEASGKLGNLFDKLGGIATVGGVVGGAMAVAGGAAVKLAGDLAMSAAPAEQVSNTFSNLANSIGEQAAPMLDKLREATRGMVADTDLMQASNKFMSMGLANSAEEAAKLAEMATQLGSAMGQDATTSMSEFAAMLANQSIPRLDNFGISSGKVRERIDELMAADASLTREQAFMTAVMEQGEVAMSRVGEQSDTTAGTMATMQAQLENLKTTLGTALLPVLASLASAVTPLIEQMGPSLTEVATQLANIISNDVIPKIIPLISEILPPLLDLLGPIVELFGVMADSLMTALAPVLSTLVTIITDLLAELTPLLEEIMPPLTKLLGSVFELIDALLPIAMGLLSDIIIPLVELLLPPMIDLLDLVISAISKLFGWLSEKLQPAFESISNAIKDVIGWLKDLKDKIASLKLPDWLTPGSPTPFELGLRGIASALKEVNTDIGGLTVNAPNQMPMRQVMVAVNITDQSFISLADTDTAEARLKPIVTDIVRKAVARV